MKPVIPGLGQNRDSVMGVSTFNAKLPHLAKVKAEEAKEAKRAKPMTIKVSFIIRPCLEACATRVMTLPTTARTSDVLGAAWAELEWLREREGSMWGPLPSNDIDDYALHFVREEVREGNPNRVAEACPPSAVFHRMLQTRQPHGEKPTSANGERSSDHPGLSSPGAAQPVGSNESDGTNAGLVSTKSTLHGAFPGSLRGKSNNHNVASTPKQHGYGSPTSSVAATPDAFGAPSPVGLGVLNSPIPASERGHHRQESSARGGGAGSIGDTDSVRTPQPFSASRVQVMVDADAEALRRQQQQQEEMQRQQYLNTPVNFVSVGPSGLHEGNFVPHVCLVVKDTFMKLEKLIVVEVATRKAIVQAEAVNAQAIVEHEVEARKLQELLVRHAEKQRVEREEYCQKESARRQVLERRYDIDTEAMLVEFRKIYADLEFGMVAQYNHIVSLRAEYQLEMQRLKEERRKREQQHKTTSSCSGTANTGAAQEVAQTALD